MELLNDLSFERSEWDYAKSDIHIDKVSTRILDGFEAAAQSLKKKQNKETKIEEKPQIKLPDCLENYNGELAIDATDDDPGNLYKRYKRRSIFTAKPGLTVLVGPNGTGKTTMLGIIERWCNKYNVICNKQDNTENSRLKEKLLLVSDYETFSTMNWSSEGESIVVAMGTFAQTMGRIVTKAKKENADKVVFLIDALDSGLSINNIQDMKKYLFNVAFEDAKSAGIDLYVIAAANSFELAYNEDCFDVKNMKHKTFKSYDAYRNFILKIAEEKNNG